MLEPEGALRRLLSVALRERSAIAIAAASAAVLSITQLYATWLFKQWVEGPILGHDDSGLRQLLIRAAAVAVVSVAALFGSRYALAWAGQRFAERLRNAAVESILGAPVNVIRASPNGEWLSRLFNDLTIASTFVATVGRRIIAEGILVAGAVVIMFALSWRLALAMTIVVPCGGGALIWIGRRIRQSATVSQQAAASLTAVISEQLTGLTTIKILQAEPQAYAHASAGAAALRRRVMRGELWSSILIGVVFLVGCGGLVAILMVGASELRQATIRETTFLAFALYAAQIVDPARRLSEVHA
ncbi:MAG TPA: ABC transporter transmembrane domain-containing protein, partial [Thermoanaerobaculia bacterium]|nr:ABC transporter transmembrane domain-containing protein [Thermoanaerobaculia bacterium]